MTYEHDLAFNLRIRGTPESQIAEVLEEVRAHASTTGTSAESEFGTPEEYASSFPKVKRRTRGSRVVIAAVILALAYVVAIFAVALIGFDIEVITGPVLLWPALVVLALGVLGGILIDYLRLAPRSNRG
ncbi:hypothetical protein [Cryobacterium sp. M23]|uniref:hypothetical protein n=1 Tax=Cryobacterium sp. M23 TaxID=2048292 RepID=UPI000CE3C278|nr:hypothetical protein [Cryobacterium sp. M23]